MYNIYYMVNTKNVAISLDSEDFIFFKQNGINRSEFMRQSLQAFKDGKFLYKKENQR